ncbi:MAG TPA: aryl-sulfate sulfotransferase [Candidatus Dormibacteraeota bacterium]|nr:aryl-sulfate sulfotransferase [Candidatus Dormibacteraeota bacterium]
MPSYGEFMMLQSERVKSLAYLMRTVLMIACILSSIVITGVAVSGVQSARPAADAFTVPVKIQTYGNAWDGYLAFGLWYFPYGGSNFSLTPDSYLVVMTTNGQVLHLRTTKGFHPVTSIPGFAGNINPVYAPIKYLGNDTLMFQGEPDTATHFWNLKTNATTDFPNVNGHHDTIYNPITGTFLTLRSYVRQIDGRNVLMDLIVELDPNGNPLWIWDTYEGGHFSLKDACLCNATAVVNGQTVIDLTHANSLQWDFQTNMIYMNMRHLDTFCKINKTTNQTIWCLGRRGDFTLLGRNGKQVPSLWYHAHDVREVQPNVFSMFDDDYDNTTNPTNPCPATFEETNAHSRMLEITVNEENMTAWESWSWTAPRQDWTPYWGSVNRLPNGDWIGDFGSQSHYLPGSGIGSPLPNSTGAVLVEVNPRGVVVRTYTFTYGWGIYRVVPIPLQTINDYDGTPRTNDFTIKLTTLNDLGGSTNIYYKINSGPTRSVATDGQPHITTQGTNNTLEYWTVDSNGIEESPHNILTGISLLESVNAGVTFGIVALVLAVAVASYAVVIRKRRRESK